MNLAFPALCLLLLVLPGILFRKTYTRGALFILPNKRQTSAITKYPSSNLPLTEEISVSLITAIMLHIIWVILWWLSGSLLHWFGWLLEWDFAVDYRKLVYLLYGELKPEVPLYHETLNYVADKHLILAVYFVSLYIASGFAGRVSLWIVRALKLDHKFMFFRLEDHWFYFLYGEIFQFAEFHRFLEKKLEITGTYVSLVVTHNGADVLYKGFLWDFYLDKSGNLDRLLLHNVIRCKFHPGSPDDKKAEETKEATQNSADTAASQREQTERQQNSIINRNWEFERVSSQIFTVKYADCKTLACTYFSITPDPGAIKSAAHHSPNKKRRKKS